MRGDGGEGEVAGVEWEVGGDWGARGVEGSEFRGYQLMFALDTPFLLSTTKRMTPSNIVFQTPSSVEPKLCEEPITPAMQGRIAYDHV